MCDYFWRSRKSRWGSPLQPEKWARRWGRRITERNPQDSQMLQWMNRLHEFHDVPPQTKSGKEVKSTATKPGSLYEGWNVVVGVAERPLLPSSPTEAHHSSALIRPPVMWAGQQSWPGELQWASQQLHFHVAPVGGEISSKNNTRNDSLQVWPISSNGLVHWYWWSLKSSFSGHRGWQDNQWDLLVF